MEHPSPKTKDLGEAIYFCFLCWWPSELSTNGMGGDCLALFYHTFPIYICGEPTSSFFLLKKSLDSKISKNNTLNWLTPYGEIGCNCLFFFLCILPFLYYNMITGVWGITVFQNSEISYWYLMNALSGSIFLITSTFTILEFW